MPEPTIQDILSIRADSELGTGNAGVVFDSKNLINTLNQAAQQKAENDWRKYNMFMGNLKDVYKDLNEIAKQPVLTEDRDKLKNTMAEIVKGISSDPKGFFGGGPKYQETLGRLSQLQGETTESKQNNLYDTAHRQYFYANPELDTPENRALVDGYRGGQLGSRSPYMLKLPGIFDPKSLSEQLKLSSVSDITTEVPDGAGHTTKTVTQEVDPAKWDKNAKAFFYSADKRGNPVVETVKKQYDQLPAGVKAKYANSVDPAFDYYMDLLSAHKPATKTAQTFENDQAWITKQNNAAQIKTTAMNNATSRDIEKQSNINARELRGEKRVDSDKDEFGVQIPGVEKDQYDNLWVPGKILETNLDYTKRRNTGQAIQNSINGTDYWTDKWVPRILKISKGKPEDDGTYKVSAKELPGLTALFAGDTIGEIGQRKGISDNQDVYIKYGKDGSPEYITINGISYDRDEVNRLVISARNRATSKGEPDPLQ